MDVRRATGRRRPCGTTMISRGGAHGGLGPQRNGGVAPPDASDANSRRDSRLSSFVSSRLKAAAIPCRSLGSIRPLLFVSRHSKR